MKLFLPVSILLVLFASNDAQTKILEVARSSNEAVPTDLKPAGYEYCTNYIVNGRFDMDETGLPRWDQDNSKDCTVIRNVGDKIVPVKHPFKGVVTIGVAPISDGIDALVLPSQGKNVAPVCNIKQDVQIKVDSSVLYAQLSWIDRSTYQGNNFNAINQYAEISLTVRGDSPGDTGTRSSLFKTTNDNTRSNDVKTTVRAYDITDLVKDKVTGDGSIYMSLALEEKSSKAPLYFQWDNVQLYVCQDRPSNDPRVTGDPHFSTWRGHHYTYNGACDLVLIHAPHFASGTGLDIHVRTNQHQEFSYISRAAVRIGDDILEVVGNPQRDYYINGELKAAIVEGETTINGYPITREILDDDQKRIVFTIDTGNNGQQIIVSTWKQFVSVRIAKGQEDDFATSVGMMGNFFTGQMFARDGKTIIDDIDAFGAEWQVGNVKDDEDEVFIFQTLGMPQYPQQCILPKAAPERRRRLGEVTVTQKMAEEACLHITDSSDRDFCIYDVLTTNDVTMAGAY